MKFSCYGKFIEDPTRYGSNILTEATKLKKYAVKPLFENFVELALEDGTAEIIEIKMKKAKVTDDKPIVIGLAILQLSKLLFIKFIYFMEHCLTNGSYKLMYCDTDSMAFALTKTLKLEKTDTLRQKLEKLFFPIVKSDKMTYFQSEWGNYFVLDDSIEQKKKPELLKSKIYET